MKKSKIILLGATFLVTLGLSFTNSTQAASTDQDNMNTLITSGDVPEPTRSAVEDFLYNYVTDDTIDVTDASFSRPTIKATSGEHSYSDFIKIPLVKKYLLKSDFDKVDQLQGVTFELEDQRPHFAEMPQTYYAGVCVRYNGRIIAYKIVYVKQPVTTEKPHSYTEPSDLVGNVSATHEEGKQYAPLLDTANGKSNRSLAPGSDWYTDKFMIDTQNASLYYRVSTSEWANEDYIRPHANTNLKISDPIESDNSTYHVSYRAIAGEPLYKSNGELWNYTLPNNTDWKITSVGFDQFGVAYYQLSTDAWARVGGANY
ncbi:hypothetical protein [Companilactobacillus zhongbaensis]|uniref:hypothetical protein n=1 Tax=Companilactobacillus zhongbaensis TaxID=2486009 RepID=UPI000F79BA71|nr:hypothetical protein [Companilactobacillus zhongbaensis]